MLYIFYLMGRSRTSHVYQLSVVFFFKSPPFLIPAAVHKTDILKAFFFLVVGVRVYGAGKRPDSKQWSSLKKKKQEWTAVVQSQKVVEEWSCPGD